MIILNSSKIKPVVGQAGFILMIWASLAEREGFEPPDLLQSTVFKTVAIDHSAISLSISPVAKRGAKVKINHYDATDVNKII